MFTEALLNLQIHLYLFPQEYTGYIEYPDTITPYRRVLHLE